MKHVLILLLYIVTSPSFAKKDKVLIVLSGENILQLKEDKKYETGFYLNELMIPVRELLNNGYELKFASPEGKIPSLDKSSDHPKYFESNKEYIEAKELLKNLKIVNPLESPILSLEDVLKSSLEKFNGIFVPGGHAPMIDLYKNKKLGIILKYFHKNRLPTALVCHGPVALLSALDKPISVVSGRTNAKNWIYDGYKMTVFSNGEEQYAEEKKLGGKVPFYPESALKRAGGILITGKNWAPNVVVDRELITAQNPSSDKQLVQALIQLIKLKLKSDSD